ncbi:CBS domain-containing protein [Falsigemmobacter intermedius]|uniref:HlyC/CorC family transporter n=1 Tax=Falsigemmobacter intermedius TaxID=1553448 RepID=A0A3S3YNQ6_9RHOB|nr:hemolysin family protein [Falsigemmobacter intermedius]RWY43272.1 HlyC/CorC family transporter [Falsigemmobacter intermedius]
MGSSTDGLMAAHGAPEAEPEQERQGGLLSRLFRKALTPVAHGQNAEAQTAAAAGISNLRRLRVEDVAAPKADIVSVPLTISRDELTEVFREHGFSRLPVYDGSPDEPLGVVTLKDFALNYALKDRTGDFDLRALLRPLIYTPPSMPLADLLHKMQAERTHMALMIDEYGSVDGVVTIEDLLETVVGDIMDEHDVVETPAWVEEAPGVWLVEATAALEELEAATGQKLRVEAEDEEIDTLGGLVYLRAGQVPASGEIITHESGAVIEVVDAEARRINTLRLRLPEAAPA